MSFRIEEKLLISSSQIFSFKKWLNEQSFSKLFEDRKIKSLYFDNIHNQMYVDSEEGISPRKKIRIRNYPDGKDNNIYFEKKISSPEGRYKNKKIIDNIYFKNLKNIGYYDESYKSCYPNLYIEYCREYYNANNCRLTIDTNIFYSSFNNPNNKFFDSQSAVEIKANFEIDIDKLRNKFPFQRIRFSKYCRGFDNLFNK
jgi:SPX domain protein involved in polyphosphate accumulation